jgi:hypothetical protein
VILASTAEIGVKDEPYEGSVRTVGEGVRFFGDRNVTSMSALTGAIGPIFNWAGIPPVEAAPCDEEWLFRTLEELEACLNTATQGSAKEAALIEAIRALLGLFDHGCAAGLYVTRLDALIGRLRGEINRERLLGHLRRLAKLCPFLFFGGWCGSGSALSAWFGELAADKAVAAGAGEADAEKVGANLLGISATCGGELGERTAFCASDGEVIVRVLQPFSVLLHAAR